MMIDDDDVTPCRTSAHFGDKAFLPRTTPLSETGIRARVQFVPQCGVFRKRRECGASAYLWCLFPGSDGAVLLDLIQPVQHQLLAQVIQFLAAKIIAAPLHIANAQLAIPIGEERLLKK